MLDSRFLLAVATVFPRCYRGERLHGAALAAMAEGDHPLALGLIRCAAARYRRELRVESLARLRVHELITRVRVQEFPERETELCLEVERRLTLLDRIESLEPPFELRPARTLLANWYVHEAEEEQIAEYSPDLLRAA